MPQFICFYSVARWIILIVQLPEHFADISLGTAIKGGDYYNKKLPYNKVLFSSLLITQISWGKLRFLDSCIQNRYIVLMLRLCLIIIFLILLFMRPFIASLVFPFKNMLHCLFLILTSLLLIKTTRNFPDYFDRKLVIRILLFLIFIILAICLSSNINRSLQQLPFYLAAILCFFTVYVMNETEKDFFIITLILSASTISLHAILWVYCGTSWLLGFLTERGLSSMLIEEFLSRNRAFIPFILPATLGGYLIMHIPLGVACYLQHYKDENIAFWIRPPKNLLLLGAVVLMLIALVLTKSIGPIASLLLSFLIFLYLHNSSQQKTLRAIIGLLGIILVVFLFVRSFNVGYWRNPIFSSIQRHLYWVKTLTVIQAYPLWGVGPGNMPFVGSWFTHNSYLQIWAESGIFALLAFLNIIFYAIKKTLTSKLLLQPFILFICIGTFSFLIHNFIDFTFFLPETSILWWGIFALFCRRQYG